MSSKGCTVSPYLLRPCRSYQEVLRERGRQERARSGAPGNARHAGRKSAGPKTTRGATTTNPTREGSDRD